MSPRNDRGTKGVVLIADDEPHIRRLLEMNLRDAQYTVVAVADGQEALERLQTDEPFDVVLLDLIMPGATGLEVLARLRRWEHRRTLPVIILTAKGQDADRARALELGAADFLTKPFSPKKLIGRIAELLERR